MRITDEVGRMQKEVVMVNFKVLSQRMLHRTEENRKFEDRDSWLRFEPMSSRIGSSISNLYKTTGHVL